MNLSICRCVQNCPGPLIFFRFVKRPENKDEIILLLSDIEDGGVNRTVIDYLSAEPVGTNGRLSSYLNFSNF
jgi:hypothetical protein